MTRGHLTLVHGFQRLAWKERLLAEAAKLFPGNESRQQKWVEARAFLINKPVKVSIGNADHRSITFARTLPPEFKGDIE